MDWVKSLGGLPETIATLVVFAFCVVWIIKAILKRVVDPLALSHRESAEITARSNQETAETIKRAIDTNTKAVEKAVDHNERIVTNHLSGQAARDVIMLAEMRGVVTSIEQANNRRRADDV